ncbi:MAG: DUF6602 domain-containing protein [Nannocystaceae bacterium]
MVQSNESMGRGFDPEHAQRAREAMEAVDVRSTPLDELVELLRALFQGIPISVPSFDPGLSLYSGHLGPKLTNTRLLTSPHSSAFSCSNSREAAVFSLAPRPGDTVTIVHWRTTKPISLGCIGYSSHLFESLGASRTLPEWTSLTEPLGVNDTSRYSEILEYLAILFAGNGAADSRNRVIAAAARLFLAGPMFDGIIFPATTMRANADETRLRPGLNASRLAFVKAEHFRIASEVEFSYSTQSRDVALELTNDGLIEWHSAPPDVATGVPRRYGTVGWQEFQTCKRELLRCFDSAKERTANRPTQTEHGPIAEAALREWLGEFLPKKFGVTSGFIIPDTRSMRYTLRHYDIIVYDALNAPVLWVEENPDKSMPGRSQAIPANHVLAVIEVKSGFTRRAILDALTKLSELKECRAHLPAHFISMLAFFEVRVPEQSTCTLAEKLVQAEIPGYVGGLILRANGLDPDLAGYFTFSKEPVVTQPNMLLARNVSTVGRNEDGGITLPGQGDSALAIADPENGIWNYDIGYTPVVNGVRLIWSYNSFTMFAFDLLTRLEGTYSPSSEDKRGGYGLSFVR